MAGHFSPALFTFLRDLKTHNDRDWFADQKARYTADVEAPFLQFIGDFAPRLRKISRAYVADPRRMGGSMFRIYRDTRFSPDKSPFKTWLAARFAHEARRKVEGVPAFYLRLSPGESFGGGGVYHLETPALTKVRQHIVAEPKRWRAVRRGGHRDRGRAAQASPGRLRSHARVRRGSETQESVHRRGIHRARGRRGRFSRSLRRVVRAIRAAARVPDESARPAVVRLYSAKTHSSGGAGWPSSSR